MQPNHLDPHRHVPEGDQERPLHGPRDTVTPSASRETVIQSRNASGGWDSRSEDSWIELASQPSSSSLSSVTANEDIVTTGLRVPHHRHRRGQRRTPASDNINVHYSHRSPSVPGSSQDEYEESESESDRVLSSSNEDIVARTRGNAVLLRGNSSASEATLSSDEDDNSTALGLNSNPPAFTPQPNAFSHPPASQTQRSIPAGFVANTVSAPSNLRTGIRRNSRSSVRSARHVRQQQQHSPYNMISPSYQADNDAALRASLSTLLSCAAAARGLPKRDSQPPTTTEKPEPSAFRLVPESVALGEDHGQECARAVAPTFNNITGQQSRTPRSSSSKRAASPTAAHKARRKSSLSRNHSPSSKRSRRVSMSQSSSMISPTVMTWVISAGVVVLFSAISFSAGYVLGREVGHTETAHGLGSNGFGGFINGSSGDDGLSGIKSGAGCGKEAVKGGLRRFRWVGGSTGSSISA
ncbi:hypothetical protein AJ78_00303 [Emergomyces pasteurianus Ep9510]|uniref:REJ domain-containing protein n=1 Tax=Emergomyces pasteurianus Ep9510 TaxID=1447872 RepID=A0A1J9QHY6_9EURO|nr:hypothetical protein AJ78_00303 [Emergomyces pasteurianus Ep9510]